MPNTKAELHCAYQWDCDNCGKENFERAVTAELTEEDRAEMTAQYGESPDGRQTGYWMTRPDSVTCKGCGFEYETTEPDGIYGDLEGEDDEGDGDGE